MESVSFSPGAGPPMYHNTTPPMLFKMMMMMMMMMIDDDDDEIPEQPCCSSIKVDHRPKLCRSTKTGWMGCSHIMGGKPSEIVSVCLDSGQLGCARLKGRMNPHPRRYCEEEQCKQGGGDDGSFGGISLNAALLCHVRERCK